MVPGPRNPRRASQGCVDPAKFIAKLRFTMVLADLWVSITLALSDVIGLGNKVSPGIRSLSGIRGVCQCMADGLGVSIVDF